MGSRQTDKYGNPAHHTGHLGAPGTTGAFETHDPLGAPGTTGASPTTGYNTTGGQEQLHRPAADVHHVPLNTTGQGYAYGTAASMGDVGHAHVAVPHTAGLTGTYDAGQGTHKTGGGTDIGHEGLHGGGYDTSVDKGRGGGYDILGKGAHGGVDKGHGSAAGGYEAGSDWGRTQGVREHGGGGGGGGKKDSHGQGVKEHSASGYDDTSHEVREHGGEYDITGRDKTREPHSGSYDSVTATGEQVHGCITATVVEIVTEDPLQEEQSKGFIDTIMEHLPGSAGGTK